MTVNELMEKIKAECTGDAAHDLQYLTELARSLRREPNATELTEAIAKHAYSIMPEDARAEMERTTMVDGKRMDIAYRDALALVNVQKFAEAEPLLAAISDKIVECFEGEKKWFSFRNPFEYHMYREFFPVDTDFDRAPFDFSHYLTLYGFVLIETHKIKEAEGVLKRAVSFDPMACEPRFELCELYKLTRADKQIIELSRETMRYCTTADRIARVLCNLGFYCTDIGDLYSAAVFYFESLRFEPSKPVEAELQDVVRLMNQAGQKFAPPTKGQTLDVYEKYHIIQPPNSELINLALALAEAARQADRPQLEGLFVRVCWDLTRNEEFKTRLDFIDQEIANRKSQES